MKKSPRVHPFLPRCFQLPHRVVKTLMVNALQDKRFANQQCLSLSVHLSNAAPLPAGLGEGSGLLWLQMWGMGARTRVGERRSSGLELGGGGTGCLRSASALGEEGIQ